jgi:hypothetical protein
MPHSRGAVLSQDSRPHCFAFVCDACPVFAVSKLLSITANTCLGVDPATGMGPARSQGSLIVFDNSKCLFAVSKHWGSITLCHAYSTTHETMGHPPSMHLDS